MLPRTHGSAVFTRGETQALVTATLGTADDQQKIEHVEGEMYKRFMLHYNFPPFSVGEVAFLRGPGRREVGHGALAERSLLPVVPGEEAFPYTVRVVSDILESNGSSSMASVCGGSLAMMDAGVPLKAPVAGVAMGLVLDETTGRYAVLSRHRRRRGPLRRHGLQGRRHRGRASPRCRWTSRWRASPPRSCARRSSRRAQGRLHILGKMAEVLAAPRPTVSAYAPRIVTIKIPVDKIRDVIGPGGKMIRSIIERTGVKIDVEDDGRVNVASVDENSAKKALAIIEELTATPELNKTYLGTVERITDFGAFVQIMPGVDGLLHVSEIAIHRVKDVRDELKEGDQLLVKVINIEPSTGKVRLSRKALLIEEQGGTYEPAPQWSAARAATAATAATVVRAAGATEPRGFSSHGATSRRSPAARRGPVLYNRADRRSRPFTARQRLLVRSAPCVDSPPRARPSRPAVALAAAGRPRGGAGRRRRTRRGTSRSRRRASPSTPPSSRCSTTTS